MTQAMALLLTLVLEVPLVMLIGRRWATPWRRLLVVALAASLVTHPFAWHGIRGLHGLLPFWVRAGVLELAVAAVEGALYARLVPLGWRRGMLLGLAANAFSFGLGLALSRSGLL